MINDEKRKNKFSKKIYKYLEVEKTNKNFRLHCQCYCTNLIYTKKLIGCTNYLSRVHANSFFGATSLVTNNSYGSQFKKKF